MKKNSFFMKLIYYALLFFVVYFAFIPVVSVITYGMNSGNEGEKIAQYIPRAIFHLKRSIFVSSIVTFIATSFGLLMSFTLNRMNFRGRRILKLMALLPLINPPFVGSIAFIMLFGRRGLITNRIMGLDVSPFGWQGIVSIQVLSLGALAYILISSSIRKMDISLEEAARNLGAKEGLIFTSVTIPMMIPEISGTALLVFLASMSDFGTPLIIGGSFQTLASDLYIQITGLYDMRAASVSGIFLLIPCLAAFIIHRYYVQKKVYFTESGAGSDIEYKNIPKWARRFAIGGTCIFVGLVAVKYGFIIIGAVTNQWGYDYTLTLSHFAKVVEKDFAPFVNSMQLSIVVAIMASFTGVLLSYIIHNKKFSVSPITDFFAVLPAAVPGILFGIGYLVTFKYPFLGIGKYIAQGSRPLVLLGTGIIIYIICIARYMNVGLRAGYALLDHLNPDLEGASYNLGAGESRTFFMVMMPLLKDAFFASFFKNFSTTMTTLGAIIFLLLPSNKVAVQQIFQIITSSSTGDAAAMALMLSITTLLMLGFFNILFYAGATVAILKEVRLKWK